MTTSTAVLESVLTCPHCGHAMHETMPTDACQFFYECGQCKTLLRPKAGRPVVWRPEFLPPRHAPARCTAWDWFRAGLRRVA